MGSTIRLRLVVPQRAPTPLLSKVDSSRGCSTLWSEAEPASAASFTPLLGDVDGSGDISTLWSEAEPASEASHTTTDWVDGTGGAPTLWSEAEREE